MKKITSLSIIMPCYNDALTIEKAISEAWNVAKQITPVFEIVVVNDASTDGSAGKLVVLQKKYKELRVITHSVNLGYGAAIGELYYAARYDWIFSVPGDYQIGANELRTLLPYAGDNTMVLGWRTKRADPTARLRQSKLYNGLLRIFFGLTLHDVNTVRFMPSHILRNVRLESASAFVDAELAIQLARQDFTILEIPIQHRMDAKQSNGNGGGGGRFATIFPTIKDMVSFWLTG